MNYLKFTSYDNGKPLWIREDQIGGWYFERGHYHLVPLWDEIDIPVKESGEEILAITKGEKVELPHNEDKPVSACGYGKMPRIPSGRRGQPSVH